MRGETEHRGWGSDLGATAWKTGLGCSVYWAGSRPGAWCRWFDPGSCTARWGGRRFWWAGVGKGWFWRYAVEGSVETVGVFCVGMVGREGSLGSDEPKSSSTVICFTIVWELWWEKRKNLWAVWNSGTYKAVLKHFLNVTIYSFSLLYYCKYNTI